MHSYPRPQGTGFRGRIERPAKRHMDDISARIRKVGLAKFAEWLLTDSH